MNKKRKKEILKSLEEKIRKTRKTAKKRYETAKDFRFASRSQQGDKLYFQNAARMAEERLTELLNLKGEVLDSPDHSPSQVEPPCFVITKDQKGNQASFYFVQNGVQLPDLQLITPESPLGNAISHRKEGEKFSYQVEGGGITHSGRIKKIE